MSMTIAIEARVVALPEKQIWCFFGNLIVCHMQPSPLVLGPPPCGGAQRANICFWIHAKAHGYEGHKKKPPPPPPPPRRRQRSLALASRRRREKVRRWHCPQTDRTRKTSDESRSRPQRNRPFLAGLPWNAAAHWAVLARCLVVMRSRVTRLEGVRPYNHPYHLGRIFRQIPPGILGRLYRSRSAVLPTLLPPSAAPVSIVAGGPGYQGWWGASHNQPCLPRSEFHSLHSHCAAVDVDAIGNDRSVRIPNRAIRADRFTPPKGYCMWEQNGWLLRTWSPSRRG